MKLTKKLTTLAIVGAISATTAVASAANIGLVQMSQVVNSYPGYGALDMKMQQVDAQYRPQIEKKMQEIDKIKDQAQAEADAGVIKAEGEAKANKAKSDSITDNLIRMKEAEAREKHGWVTVNGAGGVITNHD